MAASGEAISRRLIATCFAVAGLLSFPLAASASADTRYASPGGTGPAASCPQSDPCSLDDAVEAPAVADGDEVIVAPGPYLLADQLDVDDAISLGGSSGAVPAIAAGIPGAAIRVDAPGAVLHDVVMTQVGAGAAIEVERGTAERVAATSEGNVACVVGATGGAQSLIRDGTCWSGDAAAGGHGVEISQSGAGTRAGTLRNVTAYASGTAGTGLDASASGGGAASLDVLNVIASGTADDVAGEADATSTVALSLSSSNFVDVGTSGTGIVAITPAGSGANQTAQPLLADPGEGDFAQLAGSPTIDAGGTGPLLGERDLEGESRVQGAAPDIGADERDGAPPQTTIQSGPAATISSGKVSFSFSASEPGSTFECRLDDEDFRPCSSPETTDSLEQGSHVFRVRATDPSGNVETTPAERFFDVDKVVAGANVAAKRVQRLRGRKVRLKVSVRAGELCRARASGTVKVGRKRFRFESRQLTLIGGPERNLTLTPKEKKASREIIAALRRGEDAEAELTVTFIDLLGNRATSGDVSVAVRAGKRK